MYTKRGNLCPVPRATFGEYLESRCSRGKEYSHPKFCVVGWLHGIDKEGNDGNEMFPYVLCVKVLSPFGLKNFSRQVWLRKPTQKFVLNYLTIHLIAAWFARALSGFAKLLSPMDELWIVALLVGALQLTRALRFTTQD